MLIQVVVLRETVRRECEERSELTEALGLAKKELMLLKRPPSRHGVCVCLNNGPLRANNDEDDEDHTCTLCLEKISKCVFCNISYKTRAILVKFGTPFPE